MVDKLHSPDLATGGSRDFTVVQELSEGPLKATITRRLRETAPSYSFQIRREYSRGEARNDTFWLEKRNLFGLGLLIKKVQTAIDLLEDADRAALAGGAK